MKHVRKELKPALFQNQKFTALVKIWQVCKGNTLSWKASLVQEHKWSHQFICGHKMSIQFDQEDGHMTEGANYYQQISLSASLRVHLSAP